MKRKLLIAAGSFFALIALVAMWVLWQVPSDKEIRGCLVTKMYEVNLCPGSKDYVPLSRISPYLQKAVVVSEDASFWTHDGFDWESMEKSARENLAKGQFKRGGSTITQQLAKNMFLSKDKTLIRKGLEALITMKIEKALSKKEILERYLNVIEYGRGLFGVKNAARAYFDKSPADLDPVESAFLVMILPNPVKYSSSFHKKSLSTFARKRILRILRDMAKTGRITSDEYTAGIVRMEYLFGGVPHLDDDEQTLFDEPAEDSSVQPDAAPAEDVDVPEEDVSSEDSAGSTI